MAGQTDTGLKGEKVVKIYKDCLERDRESFATAGWCNGDIGQGEWSFTQFQVLVTVNHRWNCHGASKHAYDGTGDGWELGKSHFFDGWQTVQVAGTDELSYPFSTGALAAINAMSRGDVITYHCRSKDGTSGPGHTATSVGGATTWGANNAAMIYNPVRGKWMESWRWGQTSALDCAADLDAHWPSAFGDWTLDYVKIHRRP
jgi:hypothetical protein